MNALAQEAARELFLLNLGVHDTRNVVRWADEQVEKEESPSDTLIELSTMPPERIDGFIAGLSRLRDGSDIWAAYRDAMPSIYDYVVKNPEKTELIASTLYLLLAQYFVDTLPSDFQFIYRFGDAFDLARQGIYGDLKSVGEEFTDELKHFKKTPKCQNPNP